MELSGVVADVGVSHVLTHLATTPLGHLTREVFKRLWRTEEVCHWSWPTPQS